MKLHTSDSWDNLYGIVDDFVNGIISIYCVSMPSQRYHVGIDEADEILELVK